ncbi:MAG: magnesium transporter [Fibrobacteria bacterium]|nr:magnesium transporter [Fibrobacteria bacterium]
MMPLLKEQVFRKLAERLVLTAPDNAAKHIEKSPTEESAAFISNMPLVTASHIICRLSPVIAQRILEKLPAEKAGRILDVMDPPRAAALLARMPSDVVSEKLSGISEKKIKELTSLASFPHETAGAMMDPRVMAFHPDMKAGDTLKQLRKQPYKNAREIFLVDGDGVLCGAVPIQSLAVAESGANLDSLKDRFPLTVLSMASDNEVMDSLSQSDATSVVVVDVNKRLLGVIRRDTLIKTALETASADVQSMVGAGKEERALSSPFFVVRKRLPWLIINLGTAFLAAAVVGVFESTIAKFTALAVLLPVVAGQSGNTGAQALAVTMRGLALREVRVSQAFIVCFKELRAGFLNGIAVAVITSLAVFLWSRSLGLSLVIIISMVVSMMAAAFSGAIIPMLLTALKQDPAQSSSIVLTTVTDIVGFFSFLGIATLLSSML